MSNDDSAPSGRSETSTATATMTVTPTTADACITAERLAAWLGPVETSGGGGDSSLAPAEEVIAVVEFCLDVISSVTTLAPLEQDVCCLGIIEVREL